MITTLIICLKEIGWGIRYWAAACRPAKPVLVQLQNLKKKRVQSKWWRWQQFYFWSKVLEHHPTMCSRQPAEHGTVIAPGWWEGGITSYRENWLQFGSLIISESNIRACLLPLPLIRTISSWSHCFPHGFAMKWWDQMPWS